MKKLPWLLFALLAIGIGLYPIAYLLLDMRGALLSSKPLLLRQNAFWNAAFYTHITFGGVALLTGWPQFSTRLRRNSFTLHRLLGRMYVLAILLSGTTGFHIALHATGGLIPAAGFGTLAVLWLYTTLKAYTTIRQKQLLQHQAWMIRSYALTFAAVSLRLMIPTFLSTGLDFITAYSIIAWACWVPNLVFAQWRVNRLYAPALQS